MPRITRDALIVLCAVGLFFFVEGVLHPPIRTLGSKPIVEHAQAADSYAAAAGMPQDTDD